MHQALLIFGRQTKASPMLQPKPVSCLPSSRHRLSTSTCSPPQTPHRFQEYCFFPLSDGVFQVIYRSFPFFFDEPSLRGLLVSVSVPLLGPPRIQRRVSPLVLEPRVETALSPAEETGL